MFSYRTRCKEEEGSKDIHRVHASSSQRPVDETGKKVHGHESSVPYSGVRGVKPTRLWTEGID